MSELFSPLVLPPNLAFGLTVRALPLVHSFSPWFLWFVGILGFFLSWPLAALFLRSACDLCNVEAPGFFKALVLALVHALIAGAIGVGLGYGFGRLAKATGASATLAEVIAVILSLTISAVIAVAIYMPTLRTRFATSLRVWGWYYLISAVVYGVLLLLLIGGIATIEGLIRLA